MPYQYKVVPFIGQSRGSLSAAEVAKQLEGAISQQAAEGWEFCQLSDVNIEVKPGCIAGLFGASVQYVRFDQLIFRSNERPAEVSRADAHPKPHKTDSDKTALTMVSGKEVRQKNSGDEPRNRQSPTVTPKLLELWQRKSDAELQAAARVLYEYTKENRAAILEEISRRALDIDPQEGLKSEATENDDNVSLSFCYHCGSEVVVGSTGCDTCGKRL